MIAGKKDNMNSQNVWVAPEAKPLDPAVWQSWVAKGQAADERSSINLLRIMKGVSIAGLLGAALVWSRAAPFDIVIRFLVVAGAVSVTLQALRTERYLFAVVFALLAVLFNPIAPVFGFSGGWQRALLVASAAPFVASMAWRNRKAVA